MFKMSELSQVIDILKNFSFLKAEIYTIQDRISYLKKLLTLEDSIEDLAILEYNSPKYSGRQGLIKRPTENEAIYSNENKAENKKMIQKEIYFLDDVLHDKTRLVNRVENAMKSLRDIEEYIIKCKYFNDMTYDNIVTNLQNVPKFKNKKIWCINTVVNITKESLRKIDLLVFPRHFQTAILNNV